jgi:peroxidase
MAVIRLGVAAIVVLGAGVIGGARAQLRMGFYDESCPAAERIVGEYVRQHVGRVPTVAAALLRLHYHDCFVRVRAPRRAARPPLMRVQCLQCV